MKYETDFTNNLYARIGITDLQKKISSYPKWYNNNNHFAYDRDSIYLVDKLHLSFSTSYNSPHYSLLIKNKWERTSSYQLEEFIYFQKAECKKAEYIRRYLIVVSGMSYGNIYINNTKKQSRIQIEINNKFLYTRSSFETIENLNKVASSLDLYLDNVSKFELARDGLINMYHAYLLIYYQSDFCGAQIHEVHRNKPIYSRFGKSTYNPIITDPKNREYGTAYIGIAKSDLQVKLYGKSREISKSKKDYISAIYKEHFGTDDSISRVEVRIGSSKIKRYGLDIFDLLNPNFHIELFYTLADDKLCFKDLTTVYWDKNRNGKYDLVRLLPRQESSKKIKKVEVKKLKQSEFRKESQRIKLLIYSFLDGDINCFSINNIISDALNKPVDLEEIVNKAFITYHKPLDCKKEKFIRRIIHSKGNYFLLFKSYADYIFF